MRQNLLKLIFVSTITLIVVAIFTTRITFADYIDNPQPKCMIQATDFDGCLCWEGSCICDPDTGYCRCF